MTQASVNLEWLRELTGGDRDLEEALFQEFFSSSELLLTQLTQALESDDSNAWKSIAHALKGVAYNLGAQQMGDYCMIAQEDYEASRDVKEPLLHSISQEYGQVKTFLEKELS